MFFGWHFSVRSSGLYNDPNLTFGPFLSVVIKGAFYKFSSVYEFHKIGEEYEKTDERLLKKYFIEMKCGLSASPKPGNYQRKLN